MFQKLTTGFLLSLAVLGSLIGSAGGIVVCIHDNGQEHYYSSIEEEHCDHPPVGTNPIWQAEKDCRDIPLAGVENFRLRSEDLKHRSLLQPAFTPANTHFVAKSPTSRPSPFLPRRFSGVLRPFAASVVQTIVMRL